MATVMISPPAGALRLRKYGHNIVPILLQNNDVCVSAIRENILSARDENIHSLWRGAVADPTESGVKMTKYIVLGNQLRYYADNPFYERSYKHFYYYKFTIRILKYNILRPHTLTRRSI